MSYTVDRQTNFSTEITKMNEFEAEVKNLETKIKGNISTAETALNEGLTQFENNWSDDVATKFRDIVKIEIVGGIEAIENDLESGNFSSLKGIISTLKEDLQHCSDAKDAYRRAESVYDEHCGLDPVTGNPDPNLSYYEGNMINADDAFNRSIKKANDDFKVLAGIDFIAPTAEEAVAAGTQVETPEDTDASTVESSIPVVTTEAETRNAIYDMQPGDVVYMIGSDGKKYRVERGSKGYNVFAENEDGTYIMEKKYDRGPGKEELLSDYYNPQPSIEQQAEGQSTEEQPSRNEAIEQPINNGPLTGDAIASKLASTKPGDSPVEVQDSYGYNYSVEVVVENGRTVYLVYNSDTGELDYAVENASEVADLMS